MCFSRFVVLYGDMQRFFQRRSQVGGDGRRVFGEASLVLNALHFFESYTFNLQWGTSERSLHVRMPIFFSGAFKR